jgi:thioredoxin 2
MSEPVHVVCPSCDTVNRLLPERAGEGAACGRCKAALFPGHPVELTGASFERQVGSSGVPVVVDFWAPWCGPCRSMAPAYEQAAKQLAPKVRLAKLDTEAEPGIAGRFGIRSIPTLVAFRGGREVARVSGALPLAQLVQWIERHAA